MLTEVILGADYSPTSFTPIAAKCDYLTLSRPFSPFVGISVCPYT